MELSRIATLRQCLDEGSIDLVELAEIEAAFAEIPDHELRDERENALASDMLDELETRVGPLERGIYEYVQDNYGESEANDPSWAIKPLADYLSELEVPFGAELRPLKDIIGG